MTAARRPRLSLAESSVARLPMREQCEAAGLSELLAGCGIGARRCYVVSHLAVGCLPRLGIERSTLADLTSRAPCFSFPPAKSRGTVARRHVSKQEELWPTYARRKCNGSASAYSRALACEQTAQGIARPLSSGRRGSMASRTRCDCPTCRLRTRQAFEQIIGASFTGADAERLAREVLCEYPADALLAFMREADDAALD